MPTLIPPHVKIPSDAHSGDFKSHHDKKKSATGILNGLNSCERGRALRAGINGRSLNCGATGLRRREDRDLRCVYL